MATADRDLRIYLTVAICGALKNLDICRTRNSRSALFAGAGATTFVKRCIADGGNGLAAYSGGLLAEERHVLNSDRFRIGDLGSCFSGIAGFRGEKVVFYPDVVLGGVAKPGDFSGCERSDLFGWAPDIQKAARKTLATCDEATGSDHHVVLNDNIIENDRPHAD
jgi:hypothetical protein